MKPVTSNLACRWSLPRPIINPTRRKSGCGPGLGELVKILGSAIFLQRLGLATSDLAHSLWFAKAHHKITRRRKGGLGPGLRELPNIWGDSPSIFTQWLKLGTSNLVHSLGLPRPNINHTQWPCSIGPPQNFGVPL